MPASFSAEHIAAALRDAGVLDPSDAGALRLQPLPGNLGRQDFGSRRTYLGLRGSTPLFHLAAGSGLGGLFGRARAFAEACPAIAVRPLFHVVQGELELFGQEFFAAPTLQDAAAGLAPGRTVAAFETVRTALEATFEDSTSEAAAAELGVFEAELLALPVFSPLDRSVLAEAFFPMLREGLSRTAPRTRWTNGDLIARNILVGPDGEVRLIDCEFAARTHLYAEDWVRFSVFSTVPPLAGRLPEEGGEPWLQAYFWLRQILLEGRTNQAAQFGDRLAEKAERLFEAFGRSGHTVGGSVLFKGFESVVWKGRDTVAVHCACDAGEGFRECEPARAAMPGESRLEFRLDGGLACRELRLDPGPDYCVLHIRSATALDAVGASHRLRLVWHNGVEAGGCLMFPTTQPRLLFQPEERAVLTGAVFLLGVEAVGREALERMAGRVREVDEHRSAYRQKSLELDQARAAVAEIKQSLTWRLARLFLDPLERLKGAKGLLDRVRRLAGVDTSASAGANNPAYDYAAWHVLYCALDEADREAIRSHIAGFARRPLLSVVMPAYNTPERWLRRAIESVGSQLYPHWELCIADDASTEPHVARIVGEYADRDDRIRFVKREANGHISAASNSALALAAGEFAVFLDHDDELAEEALYMVAAALDEDPELDLVYSDEDKIDEDGRPLYGHFKTDWNPDLVLSQNFVCHLMAVRRSLVERIGGFRTGYEGSQDYDLVLRATEGLDPRRIRHIPHMLYHWRVTAGSTASSLDAKTYAVDASRRALQDHLDRMGVPAAVEAAELEIYNRVRFPLPEPLPLVSLIVPTKNQSGLLRGLVDGLLHRTGYAAFELIVVDHDSDEPALLDYLDEIRLDPRVSVLRHSGPFNFSRIMNRAFGRSRGEAVCFLNNDLEVMGPDWLGEMVSQVVRPGVGAVGAKLYYPDGSLQHGGIILGIGGVAGHSHKGLPKSDGGHGGRPFLLQTCSAVTGACMLVRREAFEAAGGFDEETFGVAFNDVDLCLRLADLGWRIVWTPYAELYHLESASRGSDETVENRPRFIREWEAMIAKWGSRLRNDPFYNPNLTLTAEDFSLACPPRAVKPWMRGRV